MAGSIPGQEFFFYKGNWTSEVDSLLLSIITKSKSAAEWDGSVIPLDLLEQVASVIVAELGLTFTWRELYERFRFFEHRYRAFKLVLDTDGVSWNFNTNLVFGAEPIWENLIQMNKLTTTYYYVGDPEFARLAQLFGPSSVKKEGGTQVVVISDDTAPVGQQTAPHPRSRLPASPTIQVSESVYSPITMDATKLRRRLFDEEGQNVEDGSTNEAPKVFYVPNHEGDLVPRCATNNNSKKPAKKSLLPSVSPHGSSCGSTSTAAWWRSAFK
ncbi:hypothetical protein AAHA92_17616 [Salvia divinorum]|uniref:Myb/SANT-like domain-containing protein n=1 Tax=Salvia divinorum TaxID=28513 RepID=A0ABD1H2J8_SALDI